MSRSRSKKADTARFVTVAGLTVGAVPLDRLVQRRTNFQAMTPGELARLDASIARFGFADFLKVAALPDGTFAVLDGHHRWRGAERAGLAEVPVIVCPIDGETDRDVAMLAFNAKAAVQPDVLYDFLKDLGATVPREDLAVAAGISAGFLAELEQLAMRPADEVRPAPTDDSPRGGRGGGTDPDGAPRLVVAVRDAAPVCVLRTAPGVELSQEFRRRAEDALGVVLVGVDPARVHDVAGEDVAFEVLRGWVEP